MNFLIYCTRPNHKYYLFTFTFLLVVSGFSHAVGQISNKKQISRIPASHQLHAALDSFYNISINQQTDKIRRSDRGRILDLLPDIRTGYNWGESIFYDHTGTPTSKLNLAFSFNTNSISRVFRAKNDKKVKLSEARIKGEIDRATAHHQLELMIEKYYCQLNIYLMWLEFYEIEEKEYKKAVKKRGKEKCIKMKKDLIKREIDMENKYCNITRTEKEIIFFSKYKRK